MGIEICTVGGYNEVGKNCTAIKVDDSVVILDMGLHLDKYIPYRESEDIIPDVKDMIKIGAVPDLSVIEKWIPDLKAIIPTHAHLDHAGAIPFLSNQFKVPIICTAFTKEIIVRMAKDEKIRLKNTIKSLNPNSKIKISKDIKIEFINMTHSTLQTTMVAVHTMYGTIIYGNDFKLDNSPVLGKPPNYKLLEKLSEKGILAAILDSTRSMREMKTPSEMVAREMLKDVLLTTKSDENLVIVTTFSSHLARLKSIVDFGKQMNRKIMFLGRSLSKYSLAGENINLVNFSKDAEIVRYSSQVKRKLREVDKKRNKYLLVITGHQGEPGSVLTKLAYGKYPFKLKRNDLIIFSCTVIPNEDNIKNREKLEEKLKKYKVRLFKDIHVSGHASKEDQRDFINLIKPEKIIPAHGSRNMRKYLEILGKEMGFKKENIILSENGQTFRLI